LDRGPHERDSLRKVLDRSATALSQGARQALAVVGVLAPVSFAREAVAATLGIALRQAGRGLGELVDYSLVHRLDQRYQISHVLVHKYASQHVAPPPEALGRLAGYFAGLVEAQTAQSLAGYAVLDAELPHLLVTLDACAAEGLRQESIDLVANLHEYLDLQGHSVERVIVLGHALAAAQQLGQRQNEGAILGNLGLAYAALGDARRAIEYYEQALVISREIGDRRGEGSRVANLGMARARSNDLDSARRLWQEALAIFQTIESPHAATVQHWLAQLPE
jgi:tetratricopeptide (TPR) repeat protein